MPRLFQRQNGTWTEIKSVFQRQNGTWVEMLNIFQRISGTWTRVFSGSKIPGNTVAPTITGTGYLYGTLTNNSLGTWTNTPTSYARQWQRGSTEGSYSNISGATGSTYVTVAADDGKYVVCRVTATNALGSNSAVSNFLYITKYAPVALTAHSITGNAVVGATLSVTPTTSNWKQTTTNTGDTSPDSYLYEWQYADTLSPAYNDTGASTYAVTAEDIGHTIRVRVLATNTGGTTTSAWSAATGTVTTAYTFAFGDFLYVNSNAYIGLDAGGYVEDTMGSGRNISIFPRDLEQWYLAEYSTNEFYALWFRSYLFNTISSPSSLNALDYQIKFYNDATIKYCDLYIVRKGANVPASALITTGYYTSGNSGFSGINAGNIVAGSKIRIYFDGTPASTTAGAWTTINDNVWKVISNTLATGGTDSSFIKVTTSANQFNNVPVNTTLPTLSTSSGNFTAESTITLNVGEWVNVNSYSYQIHYSSNATIPETSTAIKTLINTNQYGIALSDATSPSYYFRGKVTGWQNANQTGLSAIAWTEVSPRSTITPSTTISLGTATKTGFTVSGTASPRQFGVAYASISAIEIFNSSYSSVATITTGLPTVNGTNGTWSYVWSGGSGGNTYYAKATAKSTDSDATSVTTGFSAGITTIASKPPNTPGAPVAGTKTNTSIAWSWTAPSVDADHLAATGYEYNHSTSSATPTSGWTAQTGTSVTISSLTKNTTYYMHVRATNADGTSGSTYTEAKTNNDNFYTVTFSVNGSGGTAPASVTQSTVGGSVTLASAITRTGYTFGGWNTATDGTGTNYGAGTAYTPTADVTLYAKWTVAYAAVVWGAMDAPAFNRLNSSFRLRWGWNNQLPTSGDYTASSITWEWQYSSSNSTTTQSANPTGLISSGTRPNRSTGGLTVGASTYNNRVSSLSGDYNSGNPAGTGEPVAFDTANRYLRYRAVVVGSNGTTYRSNYSAWV
jgi:uncharacterized repeat protein (TIGR02543 family)